MARTCGIFTTDVFGQRFVSLIEVLAMLVTDQQLGAWQTACAARTCCGPLGQF
jgi:hypothetical protein